MLKEKTEYFATGNFEDTNGNKLPYSKWLNENEINLYLKDPESIDTIMEEYRLTAFRLKERRDLKMNQPRRFRGPMGDAYYNTISMRQCRTVLAEEGLLEQIDNFIKNIPGDAGVKARIDWEYATEVDKNYPLFGLLVSEFGLPQEKVDELFNRAKSV